MLRGYIMTKQRDFTVDLNAILTDDIVQDNFAELNGQLKSALIETYSPILDQINNLYEENPNLDMNDERVQDIAVEISLQLDKLNPDLKQSNKLLSVEHGGSSSSMESHLTFILQALQNGKNLQEIKKGYEYDSKQREGLDSKINGQFDEDFIRTKVSLVDQNGKILDPNFTKTVLSYIEGKPTSQKIINVMKGHFSMSDKQAEFLVSRFNQRSIEGVGVTFKADTSDDIDVINGHKETKLVVSEINGKPTLAGLEFNYTARCVDNSDPTIIDPVREDFSKTTYKADLRPLLVHGKGLKDVPETLTYHALHKEAAVVVPEALSHRTTKSYSDPIMQALGGLNLSGLAKMIRPASPITVTKSSSRESSVDSDVPSSPSITPTSSRSNSFDKVKSFFNL